MLVTGQRAHDTGQRAQSHQKPRGLRQLAGVTNFKGVATVEVIMRLQV